MNPNEPRPTGPIDSPTDLSRFLASLPPPIPAELREWVMQQANEVTEAELHAGLKEIQEQGGRELGEVIGALKQKRMDRGDAKP